ncbi:hypothetical protein GCM10023093_20820 [Nemorincola caseinilytica]|uniref:Beta-carotene 15,15'-monooxygenase n=1 Tax=Nemorincola caseinilytica TaxID=2054315 RepID=A0ABP8NJG2_9BACT
MLRLFRNNSPFTVLVLFLFALVIKIQALLHPHVPQPVPGHFMYNYILRAMSAALGQSGFVYTFFAIAGLFLQSLYIKNIATRHKLFPRYTYVPSYVYLLLTTIYPQFSYFGETQVLNWLLLGAVDIMFSFTQTTQPRKLIYNAAFLLCLAALFQMSLLAFFLLLVVGMVMFRPFNLGEWSVALMGYATPIYFLLCILFLFDRLYLLRLWPHVGVSLSAHVASPGLLILTIVGILILSGTGVYAMRQNVPLSNIYVRRDWTAITFYLFISMLVAVLTDAAVKSAWLMVMPALSIIISHAFLLEKNKRFSNFIFYFSLIYLLYCIRANH